MSWGTAELRFLALGDSYTIGEGVDPSQRWPVLLARRLDDGGVTVADPVIIARTGWTVGELDSGIDRAAPSGPFELVTVQIGVNDQYRGHPVSGFGEEFAAILDRAVGFAGSAPQRVIVLSIPDWGVTPFAKGQDREQIAAEIAVFNRVIATEAWRRGTTFVDVTPISRRAADDPALLVDDGLHPSGEMYSLWVDLALPVAHRIVR
ncbi:MAG TPA: SGNH/GDSL hydrolase family protein [Acidimicrobiia bacterium]|nr:SGNH/GDSL hydrolase family protein [Acidimicrobiia bacterium]